MKDGGSVWQIGIGGYPLTFLLSLPNKKQSKLCFLCEESRSLSFRPGIKDKILRHVVPQNDKRAVSTINWDL